MKNFLLALAFILPASFFAQTSITCDSIFQTSTCAGGNVIISFQVTGTFPWGNNFTAELSDNWGNWGNPLVLGSTPFTIGGNGIIFGVIPANANFGLFYRVRVVSSNPADTSNDSPNTLIVTQIAQLNQVVSNPGDSACPGDTITLYALNPANSYLWSTGDTTFSINVTSSGIYSVTTTDALTCESTASDTVVFDASLCTGIHEQALSSAVEVYPNPADAYFTVSCTVAGPAVLSVADVAGRTVLTQTIADGKNRIDVSEFPAGVYVVTITVSETTVTRKLIVN